MTTGAMDSQRDAARDELVRKAVRSTLIGGASSLALTIIKLAAGIFGHSYALIADAIESASDVLTSGVVFLGIKASSVPPDESHPHGHGKFEVVAGAVVVLMLFGASVAIAVQSVREIQTPHLTPKPFTLVVLAFVLIVKELLYRFVNRTGDEVKSTAVKADAGHHRSDALTSLAAFVGISIALVGGKGYEQADDWAALFASGFIALSAYRLGLGVFEELTDRAPDPGVERSVREIALSVPGVLGTHRCFVRKVGFYYLVELDVEVDGGRSVAEGHAIAHEVRDAIKDRSISILRVFVHVEPAVERQEKPPEAKFS